MKRLLPVLMSLLVLFVAIPFTTASADEFTMFKRCSMPDGTYEITEYAGSKTVLEIPTELFGDPIVGIHDRAFYGCENLVTVIIPDGIKVIRSEAFSGCTNLANIIIPDSVTLIEEGAFYNTAYYNDENNWENGTLYVGNHLVEVKDATSITGSYSIKEGTKTIAGKVFSGCTGLTGITIPDSVASIGSEVFSGCTNLKSITIPDNVTSIGSETFAGCTGLKSITIPGNVVSIGNGAFSGCTGLTDIKIPNSVTDIGDKAFSGCTGLKSITLSDNMTSIQNGVFSGCTSLASITIPDGVTEIAYGAFSDTAYYNNESNWKNGVLYISNHLIEAKNTISGNYSVKSGTKTISDSAFEYCLNLTGITLPEGLTAIGNYAFADCRKLPGINIPGSVTTIGTAAFAGCTELSSITFHNGVTSIGDMALQSCINLKSVYIPDSVTNIGYCTFKYCTNLKSVTLSANLTSIESGTFQDCTNLASITIPGSVTRIEYQAFEGCTSLSRITIPDSVTAIGESVFYNTAYYNNGSNWKNGVLYINNHLIKAKDTVSGDYSVKPGTKTIAEMAFFGCTNLTSVIIPESVMSLGSVTFYYLYPINDYFGEYRPIENLIIYGIEGSSAQTYAQENNTIFIPLYETAEREDGTIEITAYNGPEAKVTIPASINGKTVTSIADSSFKNCKSVIDITIPDSVTAIAPNAFDGCSPDLVIRANAGTYAESFAKENGIAFEVTASIPGDINDDGVVSTLDATLVLQMCAGIIDESMIADVNGDGSVSTLDATFILQFCAGIIQSF